jgi:hypothetical protein
MQFGKQHTASQVLLNYVPVVSAEIAALSAVIAAVTSYISIRVCRREARGNKLLPRHKSADEGGQANGLFWMRKLFAGCE